MDGEQEIQMGNEGHFEVVGKGNIDIVFTLKKKKIVTSTNVLHVPGKNMNLVNRYFFD